MKRLFLAAALGATAIGGSAVAVAQNQAAPAGTPRPLRADTDGDGNLTRAEFLARAEQRFATMDADKNGTVTRAERRAARQAMRAEGGKRGHRGGWDNHRRGPGGAGMGRPGGMLQRLDADKDGRVSRAEFSQPMTRHFDLIDANKDGFVDQSEAQTAREKMRASRGQRGPGANVPPAR